MWRYRTAARLLINCLLSSSQALSANANAIYLSERLLQTCAPNRGTGESNQFLETACFDLFCSVWRFWVTFDDDRVVICVKCQRVAVSLYNSWGITFDRWQLQLKGKYDKSLLFIIFCFCFWKYLNIWMNQSAFRQTVNHSHLWLFCNGTSQFMQLLRRVVKHNPR